MENKNLEEKKDLNNCDCGCDCGDNCNCADGACDCGCGDNCDCEDDSCHCGEHKHGHKKGDKKNSCCCSDKCSGKGIVGFLLLAFGVLYLGKNLAWWSFNMNWSVFWPIVIIFAGVMIIVKSRR